MAKLGAEMAAKLRELADWIESKDGQDVAEDKGYTEESYPRAVIADILHYCHDKGWNTHRALFYGWLRYNGEATPDDHNSEFHWKMWETLKILDKEK
jgi:hypothetical protein